MLFRAVYKTGVRFPSPIPSFRRSTRPQGAPGSACVQAERWRTRRGDRAHGGGVVAARREEVRPNLLSFYPARHGRAPPRSERATEGGDPPFPPPPHPDPRGRCFFSRAAARHDTSVRTSSPSFLFLLVSRLLGHRCALSPVQPRRGGSTQSGNLGATGFRSRGSA